MKTLKFYLFLSVCVSIFFLFYPSCQENEANMEELNKTIQAFEKAWNGRDYLEVAKFYADDAMFFIPNEDVWKKPEIQKYFEDYATRPDTLNYLKYEINRDKLEVRMEGNIAYELVNQTFDIQIEGQDPFSRKNKYVHIWEKHEDGSWKLKFDMYNSSEPVGE